MKDVEYFDYEEITPTETVKQMHSNASFKKVSKGYASFLAWGVDFQECEMGVGSYTTAIIELDDGSVHVLPAEMIKFVE